jgi:hypothetical protein
MYDVVGTDHSIYGKTTNDKVDLELSTAYRLGFSATCRAPRYTVGQQTYRVMTSTLNIFGHEQLFYKCSYCTQEISLFKIRQVREAKKQVTMRLHSHRTTPSSSSINGGCPLTFLHSECTIYGPLRVDLPKSSLYLFTPRQHEVGRALPASTSLHVGARRDTPPIPKPSFAPHARKRFSMLEIFISDVRQDQRSTDNSDDCDSGAVVHVSRG